MSRDTILKASDGTRYSLDNLATQKWLDGHAPGAERVAGWLTGQAIEAFRAGRDDEASLLRRLAARIQEELIPQLRQKAKDHEIAHPFDLSKGKA
jgi:DNA-binding GntR family transcriptional regulator